jgi:hypothetical protein
MEHRWGERRVLDLPATLVARDGGLAAQGWLRNISVSGALVKSPLPVRLYSLVQVQIVLRDTRGSSRRVSLEGQVVRQTAEGFAVEWRELGGEAIRQLTAAAVQQPLSEPSGFPELEPVNARHGVRGPG